MSLYTSLEDEVIADIARQVKKTGRYTETAELMAKSMREQGYSPEKIRVEVMKYLNADKDYQMAVAENTKAYKKEVQALIKQLVKDAKEAGDELVAEAGEMSWNADLSMWEEQGVDLKKPNNMSQLIDAFQRQTNGELRNLTRSMGFKNVGLGTVNVMNAYQREMDLALLKVCTGTFSYDEAVMESIKRLAQSGLRTINYASGRTYQLDTAARMAVRTGMSQLAGKVMEENLKSTGQDLVITSQHMSARPDHAPWQNKVFSYSGKNKKYPDFVKETGYGTAAGLKGVNCMHDFYPFWEGISIIPDDVVEPAPKTINGKEYTYYECTQQQRKMERDIRAVKREINATEALGMDSSELKATLSLKMKQYREFSDKAGMKPKMNRLRVVKNSGDINKTRVAKRKKNDIIISGARITNPDSEEADQFAKMYYAEIRKMTTDCARISTNTGYKKSDIEKIKKYLFIDESLYDADLGIWKQFVPDCAIAQSWQRLLIGKDIKPHDITLLKHEIEEMEIKRKYPLISHDDAHVLACEKYDYQTEVKKYYDHLSKYRQAE